MNLVEHVEQAFQRAEREESKLDERFGPNELRGMSTWKVRHFLNNLCELPDLKYLEIGTWQGSTLCSAMYGNEGTFYAIDHFVQDFDQWEGQSVEQLLYSNLEQRGLRDKVTFWNANSWDFDQNNIKDKINVYFYDGAHNDWAQRRALTDYYHTLADEFIYVVDDYLDSPGRESAAKAGTLQGIKQGKFDVLYEREAPRGDYHMGLGIFVLRKHPAG